MPVPGDSTVPCPARGSDEVLSRFHRLTPRELHLLILSVDHDHSYSELAQVLGVSRANVANTVSRVRRKLGVAHGQKLTDFVAAAPELAELVAPLRETEPVNWPQVARRRKDVLRVTIAELEGLASRARRRAAALASLGDVPGDLLLRREEAAMVDRVADLIENAVAQALREARHDVADHDLGAHHTPRNGTPTRSDS